MAIGKNFSKSNSQHIIQVRVDGEEHAEAALLGVKKKSDAFSASIKKQTANYIPAKKAAFDYKEALLATGVALGVVAVAAKKTLDLYAQQELIERKLFAVAGPMTDELLAQAQAYQQVSIHGDDAIIAAQTLLINIGGPKAKAQIKKATQATLDLAAAFGMDLTQAARNVGRSFGGMAGELGEILPAINDLTVEQRKNGEVVDLLIAKYGGQSEAETDTLFGAMSQAENVAKDVGEAFGKNIAPAASFAAKMIKSLSEEVIKFNQTFEGSNLRRLVEAGGGGTKGLAFVLGAHGAKTLFGENKAFDQLEKAALLHKKTMEIATAKIIAKLRERGIGFKEGELPAEAGLFGADLAAQIDRENAAARSKRKRRTPTKADLADESLSGMQGGRQGSAMPEEALKRQKKIRDQQFKDWFEGEQEKETARLAAFDAQVERDEFLAESQKKLQKQQIENSKALRDSILDNVNTSARAYGQFFGDLFNANRKTMHKIQKATLFIEGGMAVTRGVISLQVALSRLAQTQGGSAADIPGSVALISSGTMMMAGQLLTGGRGRGGGGGHGGAGRAPRMGAGTGRGGGDNPIYHINMNFEGTVHDEGTLGVTIDRALKRATLENRI